MALTITIDGKGVIANSDGLTDSAGGVWAELGAGAISLSTETYLYGSSCVAGAYSNKAGWHYYDIGVGNALNFGVGGAEVDQFIYLPIFNPTPGLNETTVNRGLRIRLGTTTTAYREFMILSSNDFNQWNGSWKTFVIDPTKTGSWADTGTYNPASIQYIGIYVDAVALAKGDNIFIDQISVGRGLRVTGTSTNGWEEIVNYCTDYPNRAYGMVEKRGDTIYVKGKIFIGSSTQTAITDFSDAGRTIQFEKSEYYNGTIWTSTLPSTACGIEIADSASFQTYFQDGVIVGTENGRSGSNFLGNNNESVSLKFEGGLNTLSTTKLYGSKFKSIYGTITIGDTGIHSMYGCSFVDCSQVNPVKSPSIRNCIFAETSDVDAALLWNDRIDIEKSSFIANTTGAAIEMPSSLNSPFNYKALSFSGNTFDVYNSSLGAIVINKLSGSDPSTHEGAGVTFSATFSHIIEGLELNTEVTYVTANTSTELYHVESATTADGSGKYKTTYSHSGGALVDILIHHVNYQPDISNIYGLLLPSADATVKVQMFIDDNYLNP